MIYLNISEEEEEYEDSEYSSDEEQESEDAESGSQDKEAFVKLKPEKTSQNINAANQPFIINAAITTANQLCTNPEYQKMDAEEYVTNIYKLQDYSRDVKYFKKNLIVDKWDEALPSEYINPMFSVLKSRNFPSGFDDPRETKKQKKPKNQIEYSKIKNKQQTPQSLKALKSVSIVILFFFLGYGITQYYVLESNMEVYKINFHLINLSFRALYNFHICTYSIRNLILLQDPNYDILNDYNRTTFINLNLDNLYKYQQELTVINQLISNSSLNLELKHKDLFLDPQVPLLIFRGPDNMVTTSVFNLLYAIDVQISFVLNLLPGGMTDMVETNPMIMAFVYNNFNQFIDNLYLSTNYYIDVTIFIFI